MMSNAMCVEPTNKLVNTCQLPTVGTKPGVSKNTQENQSQLKAQLDTICFVPTLQLPMLVCYLTLICGGGFLVKVEAALHSVSN